MPTGDGSPSHGKLPWLGECRNPSTSIISGWLREGDLTCRYPAHSSRLSVALALTSVTFFTTSASGQSPATRPDSTVAVSEPKPGSAENKVAAEEPKPKDLQSEIEAVKTENAAVRELLRKMEEQQKILLEQVDRLQRRLDGGAATDVSIAGQPIVPPTTADASVPAANAALNTPQAVTNSASTSVQPASVAAPQTNDDRYRDGMVIWQTPEDAKVPFLLKFNINTQLRYLNTLSSDETFTDHLGVVREVHTTQRHHGKSRDVHLGRLHLRQEAAI